MTGSLPCSCSCLSESLHIAPLHIALKITEMGEGEITEIGKGEKRDGKDFNAWGATFIGSDVFLNFDVWAS